MEKEIEKKEQDSVSAILSTWISKRLFLVRKECRASTIVEMAYLMPVVLLMWMLIIFALFYYHDKTLVIGAAYETVAVSGEWYKEMDAVDTDQVSEYFQNRIQGKLLFFSHISVDTQTEGEWIILDAQSRRKGMKIHVNKKIKIRNPEKELRKIQMIKDGLEDLAD